MIDVVVNPDFDGDDYVADRDNARLTNQIDKVRMYSSENNAGIYRVNECLVKQIAADLKQPEPSVSAQIRNLRKDRFGARTVNREYRGNGCYAFKLEPKERV
jgi:hypothetical protein